MKLSIKTIDITTDIPEYMTTQDIQKATMNDIHLKDIKVYITEGRPSSRADVKQGIQPYWPLTDKLAMIDGLAMKGR